MMTEEPAIADEVKQASAVTERYAGEAMAASYIEAEWPDFVLDDEQRTRCQEPGAETPLPRRIIAGALTRPQSFNGTVLDVGAATGRLLWEWYRRFSATKRMVLVEPSEPFVRYAKRCQSRYSAIVVRSSG